jgi:hypothetical protein
VQVWPDHNVARKRVHPPRPTITRDQVGSREDIAAERRPVIFDAAQRPHDHQGFFQCACPHRERAHELGRAQVLHPRSRHSRGAAATSKQHRLNGAHDRRRSSRGRSTRATSTQDWRPQQSPSVSQFISQESGPQHRSRIHPPPPPTIQFTWCCGNTIEFAHRTAVRRTQGLYFSDSK